MISRRRALAALCACVAAAVVRAQGTNSVPRIGFLRHVPAELDSFQKEAFRAGLRDFGYIEGKTIIVLDRYTAGREELLTRHAEELAKLPVDIFVTAGTPAVGAALRATRTIPIVAVSVADPIGSGLIASLARPGGNLTGVSAAFSDIAGKWLELLRAVAPGLKRIGFLANPGNPGNRSSLASLQAAARDERVPGRLVHQARGRRLGGRTRRGLRLGRSAKRSPSPAPLAEARPHTERPPARRTPSITCAASARWLKLHGIVPIHSCATITSGRPRSSRVNPTEAKYDRALARLGPSTSVRLR